MSKKRTYSDLVQLQTYRERYEYLKLEGSVGKDTFGFDRYLNQNFYRSAEWKKVRNYVIVRDDGCDMGVPGYDIHGKIMIHHMNPMTPDEIAHGCDDILNPEYLICVSYDTHNAIHYGADVTAPLKYEMAERRPNDTCPWRK